MERKEVYKAIDSERDFQEKMIASQARPDMIEDLHVGDTLTAIQYNLDKAKEAWYKGAAPHGGAMEFLRKIAGLIVQAGENYGMPFRENCCGTQQQLVIMATGLNRLCRTCGEATPVTGDLKKKY